MRKLIVASILSTLPQLSTADTDVWTRKSDQKKLNASLIEFNVETNMVTLKNAKGKEFTFDASTLSESDQQKLSAYAEKKEASKQGRVTTVIPKDGGGYAMHIYRPAGYIDEDSKNKERPLAFVYSPNGKSKMVFDLFKEGADKLGWVVISSDAYKNGRDFGDVRKHTTAAYEQALKEVSFDKNKVVFGGFSGGGLWSFRSSVYINPKTAGVISFGGWLSNNYDLDYADRMAVVILNGEKDTRAQPFETPDSEHLKKKHRAKIKIDRYAGGHVLPKPEDITRSMEWIHSTKKF